VGVTAYPIPELSALRHNAGHPAIFLRLKAIVALVESQVSHDVVRKPIAPVGHIPRQTPILPFLSCVPRTLPSIIFWPEQSDECPDVATDDILLRRSQRSIRKGMAEKATPGGMLLLIDLGMRCRTSIQHLVEV
jgi:hypothetical protein